MTQEATSIRVSKTFKNWLVTHGNYGDTHEQILIKLLGDNFKIPSGDRDTKTYDKDDIDSHKYKAKRRVGNTTSRSHKTSSDKEEGKDK